MFSDWFQNVEWHISVCAFKCISSFLVLLYVPILNIESQPSLIGGPARTEKQGKLELKEHAPTPTPPLLPLSLTNPTNPQVTNPKLLNPQIHLMLVKEESWPKNVRCQQNLESWERKKKKTWNLNILQNGPRQCFWPQKYLFNEQCLLPPRPPRSHLVTNPSLQISNWSACRSGVRGGDVRRNFWKLRTSRFRGFGFRSERSQNLVKTQDPSVKHIWLI